MILLVSLPLYPALYILKTFSIKNRLKTRKKKRNKTTTNNEKDLHQSSKACHVTSLKIQSYLQQEVLFLH